MLTQSLLNTSAIQAVTSNTIKMHNNEQNASLTNLYLSHGHHLFHHCIRHHNYCRSLRSLEGGNKSNEITNQ